jgi:tol-pal system protein YbgF
MKKILFLLVFALMASCVKTGNYDTLNLKVRNQEQRLLDLQKEQTTAREQMTSVQPAQADLWAEVKEMRGILAALEGRLDSMDRQTLAMTKSQGNATVVLSTLTQEVNELQFQFNQAVAQLALTLEPSPTASQTDSSGAVSATENVGNAGTADATAKKAEETAPQKKSKADPAKALYDQAFQEFKAKNYIIARSMWEEFQKSFPNHKLIPNAIFWQGECYYQVGKYDEAILKYQEVIEQHPKSDKYPAALLKQGVSFIRTDKKKPGAYLLEELIKHFPKAPEARQAKYYLKKLK